MRLLTWAQRPDLAERGPPSSEIWPEYNLHGDQVVAEAHTGPLTWTGVDTELPDGIDAALRLAVSARRAGAPVDTLCAFAAEVSPAARERGMAAEILRGMSELARGTA